MKVDTGGIDLNKVETGIPILPAGDYNVKVESMESRPNKAGDSEVLWFKLVLEDNATSRDGETLHAGFPIFGRASLKVTEKYDPIRRHLAPLMDCFLGFRTNEFETEDFVGKSGRVRLQIRQDPEYGESNEIKSYIAKKG
jgi:hypothetical protein